MVILFIEFYFFNYPALPEHLSEVNPEPSLQPLIYQVCQWLLLHLWLLKLSTDGLAGVNRSQLSAIWLVYWLLLK